MESLFAKLPATRHTKRSPRRYSGAIRESAATQDAGKGILAHDKGGTLGDKIVALHRAIDVSRIASDQPLERRVWREHIARLGRSDFLRG
jgi:hypothetical protein